MAIINPSFETGDMSGWTTGSTGNGGTSIAEGGVDGNYHASIQTGNTYPSWTYFGQNIDLTGVDSLTFWAKGNSVGNYFRVMVDNNATAINFPDVNIFYYYEINVSEYTGLIDISWEAAHQDSSRKYLYIDNIRLDGVGWLPTISGTVYDENGVPLRGVSIEAIDTTTYNTTSASNGTYSLDVESDIYSMALSKSGYNNGSDTIDATSGDKTKDFTLTRSGYVMIGIDDGGMSILGGIPSGKQHMPGLSIHGGISLGAK